MGPRPSESHAFPGFNETLIRCFIGYRPDITLAPAAPTVTTPSWIRTRKAATFPQIEALQDRKPTHRQRMARTHKDPDQALSELWTWLSVTRNGMTCGNSKTSPPESNPTTLNRGNGSGKQPHRRRPSQPGTSNADSPATPSTNSSTPTATAQLPFELARRYIISKTAVLNLLTREGITRRHQPLNDTDIDHLERLYLAGHSLASCSRLTGHPPARSKTHSTPAAPPCAPPAATLTTINDPDTRRRHARTSHQFDGASEYSAVSRRCEPGQRTQATRPRPPYRATRHAGGVSKPVVAAIDRTRGSVHRVTGCGT